MDSGAISWIRRRARLMSPPHLRLYRRRHRARGDDSRLAHGAGSIAPQATGPIRHATRMKKESRPIAMVEHRGARGMEVRGGSPHASGNTNTIPDPRADREGGSRDRPCRVLHGGRGQ